VDSVFLACTHYAINKAERYKHVLNKDPSLRRQAQSITLGVNVEKEGEIVGEYVDYPLIYEDGRPAWQGHPDDDVDVLAIDATPLIDGWDKLIWKHAQYSAFADKQLIEKHQITADDEVVVVGYPLGLRQRKTNYPLVRQGMLSTRVDGGLYDEDTKRTLRGFLIDGATVPGASGSPVLLKPVTKIDPEHGIMEVPAWLLGIVAETRYNPTKTPTGHVSSYTGLGFAFHNETIRETIDFILSR
jgi:hypothetical protein